jgi:predicted amidophosphoribosyltransferase
MNELVSARPEQPPSHGIRLRENMRAALRLILDFALPPLCPSCREPLGEGTGLCASCWSQLSFIEPPYCARLGIPFAYDPGSGLLSMEAIANPPAYDRARAAVRYDDVARTLVQAFKYSDRLDLAPMMGRWMARAGRELFVDADVLIPVPLHWRRRWARRFNHPRRSPGRSLHSAVCRFRTPDSNVRARRRTKWGVQRRSALKVQGAFVVPGEHRTEIAGRRLILVDDVLTSGATVDACTRALLRAGASHIDVLVFARVVAPARTLI